MKDEMTSLKCGRENDLVDFLYGELKPTEKFDFSRHMQNCSECRLQLASFTDIRQSVVQWRQESLGAMSSVFENPMVAEQQKPSAWAALREFFNLSPLWMKGAVAFGSVLFVLFSVLAIARFNDEPVVKTVVATHTNSNTIFKQEIDAQVERRVQEELQRRTAAVPASTNPNTEKVVRSRPNRSNRLIAASSQRKAGRPLSKLERQELAADLGLIDDGNESDLVLIGDRINQ